jgi:hypothetical protein
MPTFGYTPEEGTCAALKLAACATVSLDTDLGDNIKWALENFLKCIEQMTDGRVSNTEVGYVDDENLQ